MATQTKNAKEIFVEAIEQYAPSQWPEFLNEACGNDTSLRKRVEILLKAHIGNESLLDRPAIAPAPTLEQPTERLGTLIGRYKLLEQVGEGGMGVVYVAEQTEPVRRRVALKIIKPGMDTKQVIARFEAERQALAMMDHPNIARVLDAGTTEAGRPYFVMELVRGMPITEYCDKAHLSPRQRLELFIDVCQAVQHAHQKGIIHRDLKPSNVMITLHDGTPVVKVIDFGVAKAVGQQLTERTIYTALTQLVGTPLYMSPEQAEMSGLDVDTRSDVYSLGVLLYELLTGHTPFDKETLSKAGLDEMRRIIREDEPLRPSRRFSTLGAGAISTASQHRGLDERRLSKILCGELDWIVMKALEKDRSRRYESASSLATDIQRYLSDEPVLACPPTTMYRFQKFARKHKPALATAAAISLCLILGTTVSAWQAVRATTAEAQANASEQKAVANEQKANTERDEARKQRDEVEALNEKLRATNAQLQATQADLHRTLYASNVNLVRHAWEANDPSQPLELLSQHLPKPGEPDLRGFEWFYLDRMTRPVLDLKTGSDASVAYSPDGKHLATCGSGEIKVFDAETGREILTIKGGTGGNHGLAFSPDGKRLIAPAGAGTQEAKLWDAETGQELIVFKGHTGRVNSVAFSADGKRVAGSGSSTTDGKPGREVTVWDCETGQVLLSVRGPANVGNVAFSPDGKQLASGSKVFDALTGQELFDLRQQMDPYVSFRVSYSPDGKRLAIGAEQGAKVEQGLRVWDTQTGKLLSTQVIPEGVSSVAYSPDGRYLASTCNDRTVKLWDAQTGKEAFTIKGIGWWASSLAFSPDGKRLVTNGGYTVRIWDVTKDQRHFTLKVTDDRDVDSAAFSPDGKRLITSVQGSNLRVGEVKVWDAYASKELLSLSIVETTGRVGNVACSPDGKRLATDGQSLKIWDALTGQQLKSFGDDSQNGISLSSVSFSPDGKSVAACSRRPGPQGPRGPSYVKVWDTQTGEEQLHITDTNVVQTVTFSPDGKRLATSIRPPRVQGQPKGEIKVWDAKTGQEILTIMSPPVDGAVGQIVFSPDGKLLATSNGRIWDAETGKEFLCLPGYFDYCTGIAFSPDGKRVVAASADKTVKVYDVQTGRELLTVEGHSGYSNGIAFSPDGYRLACGGANGNVNIYDATPLPEKP